jgi:hypothetical protein
VRRGAPALPSGENRCKQSDQGRHEHGSVSEPKPDIVVEKRKEKREDNEEK